MSSALPKISQCRSLGHLPAVRTDAYVVIGQDGGQSVRLNGGSCAKTLFFFSDTLLMRKDADLAMANAFAPPLPIPQMPQTIFLSNCAALSEGDDLSTLVSNFRYFQTADGLPREILEPTERERFRNLRFWPEHGIWIDGKVYFFYLGIQTVDSSSIWGFLNLGVGLAALDPERGNCVRFQHKDDWIFWRAMDADLHIGVQVLREGDAIYVFGSRRRNLEDTAFLMRVPAGFQTDRNAYEFLSSTAPTWSNDVNDACDLGLCAPEYSVSFNPYLGRYTMIYVDGGRRKLVARTAEKLWGPYGAPVALIGVPCRESSALVYLGFEHAAFQRKDGRQIFVTYCEPDFSPATLITVTF